MDCYEAQWFVAFPQNYYADKDDSGIRLGIGWRLRNWQKKRIHG